MSKNIINLEDIKISEYNDEDASAIRELAKVPNYYKVLGVDEDATVEEIKKASEKKMEKYSPDNIKFKKHLSKLSDSERLAESNKNNAIISLIREARKVLINKDARKIYDMEKKISIDGSFSNMKSKFKEFVRLQKSEISDATRKTAELAFKNEYIELDKKHKIDRNLEGKISEDDAIRKYNELEEQREMDELEFEPEMKFDSSNFNPEKFNKYWKLIQDKKNKKEGIIDNSMMLWDDIGAANDFGDNGCDNYASLNNIGDIYVDDKKNTGIYSGIYDDDNISLDDINLDDISGDEDYYGHNKGKITEYEINSKIRERDDFLETQKHISQGDTNYWKSVMDNPMNISKQLGRVIGGPEQSQLPYNQRKRFINSSHVDAYKELTFKKSHHKSSKHNEDEKKKHHHKHRSSKHETDEKTHHKSSKHHHKSSDENKLVYEN